MKTYVVTYRLTGVQTSLVKANNLSEARKKFKERIDLEGVSFEVEKFGRPTFALDDEDACVEIPETQR